MVDQNGRLVSAGDWRPSAELDALKARAGLLQATRAFFYARHYMEVDTPCLAHAGTTDANIESISAQSTGFGTLWLQTSPEFAMKRLLAAQSGPIFQISHAFREGEAGRWHNPEFSLLEWYVPGFDHRRLMNEVEQFMRVVAPDQEWPQRFAQRTYRDCFLEHLGIDPFVCGIEELAARAQGLGLALDAQMTRDDWLDLLMGECIGPKLGMGTPCFITDYPASQAALARVRPASAAASLEDSFAVASRFELYWQGLELANGFHELADAHEQRRRFELDLTLRSAQNKQRPPVDEYLLGALQAGLPDCAGVAVGMDRLLALLMGKNSLAPVLSFPIDRI